MPPPIRTTRLRRGDRERPEQEIRTRTTPQRVVERARIVLASSDGTSGNVIAEELDVSRPTVSRWLDRYDQVGLARPIRHPVRSAELTVRIGLR